MSCAIDRLWSIMTALLLAVAVVACCGPKAIPTEVPPTEVSPIEATESPIAEEEPVTIVFWHWKFGQEPFIEWTNWLKTEYEAAHPGVTIEYYGPPEINAEVSAAIASGEGVPDIVGVGPNSWNFEMMAAGNWLDLGPFIDADPEWQEIIESWSAIPEAAYMYKGQILNANLTNGPQFIYYWKDLFEQAGAQPPKTLDELFALPSKFDAIGVDTMASGLDSTSLWQYGPWFWTLAGAIDHDWAVQRQADECAQPWAGDPVAKQALETLQRIYEDGVLRKQAPQEKYEEARLAFARKEVAMFYVAGVWDNEILEDIDNAGVLYFPPMAEGDGGLFMGSNDIAVAVANVTEEQKNPERQQVVVDFVKFMCSLDSQKKIWEVGLMPLMPEAVTSEDTGEQRLTAAQIRMCASPDARTLLYQFRDPELGKSIRDSMLGMLLGAKTPDEVLADADAACAASQ